jgi:hypothetical protein
MLVKPMQRVSGAKHRFAQHCLGGMIAVLLTASVICPITLPALAQSAPPVYTPGDEAPEEFPAGPGRDETFYACVACHNFKLVAAQGMNRERWDGTLTYMTQRHGMPAIEGDDRRLILDYLAAAFPERPAQRPGWRNPFQPQP